MLLYFVVYEKGTR